MQMRWAAMLLALAPLVAGAQDGARIVGVEPWLGSAEAGLKPGDRLLAVAPQHAAHGERLIVRDPLDALVAEMRWARVGGAEVDIVDAAGKTRPVQLPPDAWGLRYVEGDVATLCGAPAAGLEAREAAWHHWACAEAAAAQRDWATARPALLAALDAARGDADLQLSLRIAYARHATNARQWDEFDAVLGLPASADASESLTLQLRSADASGDVIRSRYAQGLAKLDAVLADLAPRFGHTQLEAYALTDQGFALRQLERFDDAQRAYLAALALHERHRPLSLGAGNARLGLGMLRRAQGNLSGARSEVEQALTILRKVAPASRVSNALNNLSLIAWDAGDFVAAEALQSESLAISQRLSPDGFDVAVSLQNLGAMALDKGDVASAETHLLRAQAIFERIAPVSNSLALGLQHLARVDEAREDLAAAAEKYQQSNAILQQISPGSLREAWNLHNLGGNALSQGRLDEAARWLRESLAIRSKVAPGGMDEARGFNLLASIEIAAGQWDAARAHLALSLATWQRLAPESEHHAIALNALGQVERAQGHPEPALLRFCEADRVLDLQRRRVSVSRELQSEYAARRTRIPADCARARIEAGDAAAALEVVERSRARALRARLGDFRVAFAGLPDAWRDAQGDLAARRSRLEAGYAATAQSGDPARQETLARDLLALERDERAWLASLAQRAPRVARELDPSLEAAQATTGRLPDDTAVASFLVGSERSYAWLLSGADNTLRVVEVKLDEAGAARLSAGLHRRIVAREPETALRPALQAAYATLLGAFAAELSKVQRLLIVPDGGLQLVPFAALVDAQGRYLVETHDLALAPSIAIAVGRDALPPGEASLVGVAVTQSRRLAFGEQSREFAAIPSAAGEVRAIASDYPAAARLFIDADADEAAVRAAATDASVLHIAAHGYFDAQRPLDSGLLLAPGDQGDGVLHAWEVMAQWRLDRTRLVVLSACDTGVGEELAGEGLLGLGRAFQYAGARGVVASLWPVADKSTAALMQHLHRGLVRGLRPAAALVQAQRAFLRDAQHADWPLRGVGGVATRGTASARHPFHWAAFKLLGQLP